MSTVDPLGALAGSSAARTEKPRDQLGQTEFLRLMVTQLRNQDPFKPLDPNEFLGQLAQFSTVTGIQSMQGSFGELAASLRASQVLDGAALVGREVLAPAAAAPLAAGGTVRGAVDVPDAAASVQIAVHDAAGQLVRRFALVPQPGLVEFTWDGLTDAGTPAPAGQYRFEATAGIGGGSVSLDPLLSSRVASVTIDPRRGALTLNTGIGPLALADVRRVM